MREKVIAVVMRGERPLWILAATGGVIALSMGIVSGMHTLDEWEEIHLRVSEYLSTDYP